MPGARFVDIRSVSVAGSPLRRRAISGRRLRRAVFRILRQNALCSMATVTRERRAHANTGYFCYSDDLELYFLSHPGARHCRNVSGNGTMAMVVFSSEQPWGELGRGLQLFGTCAETRGRRAKEAERLYGKRFPEYRRWIASLPDEAEPREYRFFRFRVKLVKVIDESEFGDAVLVVARLAAGRR